MQEKAVEDLEKEKAVLIEKYMELQNIVDDYNDQIYKICCEIEGLNKLIEQRKAQQSLTQG